MLTEEIILKKAARITCCQTDVQCVIPLSRWIIIICLMTKQISELCSSNVRFSNCIKRTTFSRMHLFFCKRLEEVKTSERYLFVNEFRYKYCTKAICRFLKIIESGYYRWLRNQGKPGAMQLLLIKIQGILSEHPDNKIKYQENTDSSCTAWNLRQPQNNLSHYEWSWTYSQTPQT